MTKNILFLTFLFFASSSSAQTDYKEYYFQIGAEKEVKVYKYIDKNDSDKTEYWRVTADPEAQTLRTESYNSDFRLYNIFEEVFKPHGAELSRYVDFFKNNRGENVEAKGAISDNDVYKWQDETTYQYSVEYKHPMYGYEKFTKSRTKQKVQSITVNGTDYPALKFLDEYEIRSLETNQFINFYQYAYYAKGVGMVKYERHLPNGTTVELELAGILTDKAFEKLMEKALSKK